MLKLAKNVELTDVIDQDGVNPLITEHPLQGDTKIIPIYLFNDEADISYTNVIVSVEDWLSISESSSANFNTELSIGAIIGIYSKTIYVKVASTQQLDVQEKSNLSIRVQFN